MCHVSYYLISHFYFFMPIYSKDVDMGDNCIYLKVSLLYENSDLCLYCMTQTRPYIPEGIITIRDSDLCLYYVTQTGCYNDSNEAALMTQTGPTYNL